MHTEFIVHTDPEEFGIHIAVHIPWRTVLRCGLRVAYWCVLFIFLCGIAAVTQHCSRVALETATTIRFFFTEWWEVYRIQNGF